MADNPCFVLSDGTTTMLAPHLYGRNDETDDEMFYAVPRLVTHIDEGACGALSEFYENILEPGAKVLDLMSSCVSHLPTNAAYGEVVGLGMNHMELGKNSQLSRYIVQNLNRETRLPFGDGLFDACLLAVSIQYLVKPVEVFRDVARVLKLSAPMIISYSNRLFPTKAVMIWRMLDDVDHGRLIAHYFETSEYFDDPEIIDLSPDLGNSDPLYVVVAKRSRTSD